MDSNKKKIYCLLPHDDSIIKEDTSFANRILQWEFCHFINKIYDNKFIIILQKKYNNDLETLFDLPNTRFEIFNKKNIVEEYKDILELNINEKKILDGGFNFVDDVYCIGKVDLAILSDHSRKKYRTLHFFKNSKIYNEIKETQEGKEYIGLHLRRGRGVQIPNTDILELSEPQKIKFKSYKETLITHFEENMFTIPDKLILDVIKTYQRYGYSDFFLSTDIPLEYCEYYFDNINNLQTSEKFVIFDNEIRYIYDFLFLANCKKLIGSDFSSFFKISQQINNVDWIDITPKYAYKIKNNENNIGNG